MIYIYYNTYYNIYIYVCMYIYYNIYIHRTRSAEYFWLRTSKLEALWDRPSYRMRRFNLTAEPGVGGSALRVNGLASGKARKNLGNPMENHGKYWYITYTTSTKQCRVSRIGHGTATLNIDKTRGNHGKLCSYGHGY